MTSRMPPPWVVRWIGLLLRGRHAGDTALACNDASLAALPATLALRSPAFSDGGAMPLRSAGTGVGANRSPALDWNPLPGAATHWLLLVEDPDVPLARALVHALAWGPAARRGLAEGALAGGQAPAGVTLALNGLGAAGYDGPRPLHGHGPHRYVFQLYALSASPPAALERATLVAWLRRHAVARGRLDGVFQRDWRGRVLAPAAALP
ncbi:YbhB/YbcL family Raf kinase inhibitor-like protein [Cupriavidus sp. 2TAF22]|uniref:YbhB/YbcL family Raf kinase inhibitor-like protein n=1 Tax=unclassified Cupriavidus TaxID=2640874 RepID=UPI003F8F21DF